MSKGSVLILTQRVGSFRALEAAIRLQSDVEKVSGMLWDQTAVLGASAAIEGSYAGSDELFRESRRGIWAQGGNLAERFSHGVPFLIVAPRYWADEIQVPGYWDVASTDSIGERVQSLLANPELAWENFERIKAKVAHCWNEPEAH